MIPAREDVLVLISEKEVSREPDPMTYRLNNLIQTIKESGKERRLFYHQDLGLINQTTKLVEYADRCIFDKMKWPDDWNEGWKVMFVEGEHVIFPMM